MKYTIDKNGLNITCTIEEQLELRNLGADIITNNTMYEFFEPLVANGLCWVAPEDIGALTDAPILSDGAPLDAGEWPGDADFFWYPNYMVRSPLEDLRDCGNAFFNRADNGEDKVDGSK